MPKINHLDIYRQLNRSNCRECGLPACMAFALAVMRGDKKIEDCPHLDREAAKELSSGIITSDRDDEFQKAIGPLKKAMADVDFSAVAEGLGAVLDGNRLRIKCLGRDFLIDKHGGAESMVHINPWVLMPLLKYIKTHGNKEMTGRWISFGELQKGSSMEQYFTKRCEESLRLLADHHTDIFFDLIQIFGGRSADGFSADYARVIYPLPKVPFLILYWRAEGQFESRLRILVDSSADAYLDAHSIFALARGIVEMFKKILARHEELLPGLLAL